MAEEKTAWKYQPETNPKAQPTKNPEALTWSASEYIDHRQGASWYLLLGVSTIILAAAIYLITKDIFAVVVTIMLGLIVGIFAHRTPKQLTYELNDNGLIIDGKAYPYRNFKSFSFIPDGPLTSLNLVSVKRFMPPLSVYFNAADQDKIVALLQDHLAYEQRQLETIERLTRQLRF